MVFGLNHFIILYFVKFARHPNFDIDCLKSVFVLLHYCNIILRSYTSILQHNTPDERVMLQKLPSLKMVLYCIAHFQPKRSESIGINTVFLSMPYRALSNQAIFCRFLMDITMFVSGCPRLRSLAN